MAVAFMLLRFQELFVQEGNHKRFDMVDLCYMLAADDAYGVMFFDKDFDQGFQFAETPSGDFNDLCQWCARTPSCSIVSVWNAVSTGRLFLLTSKS